MSWETGTYAHPQGARLTYVTLTVLEPVETDHMAVVYWREHELDPETAVGEVTIYAGHRLGMTPLEGQVMRPFDSLVRVASDEDAPSGLTVRVGFNR